MKYSDYYSKYYYSIFKRIYVIRDVLDEVPVQRAIKRLDKLPLYIIDSKDEILKAILTAALCY